MSARRKRAAEKKGGESVRKFRVRPGASPGTIEVTPGGPVAVITAIGFSKEGCEEQRGASLSDVSALRNKWPSVWVHVVGLGDLETLNGLQEMLSLHNLALEDVINQNQRTKIESYDDNEYLVLFSATEKVSGFNAEFSVSLQQVNMFVGEGMVLTIEEYPDVWDEPVRSRIRDGGVRFQTLGIPYLAYAIVDAVVDHYFPLMDRLAETLLELETAALYTPGRDDIARIHRITGSLSSLHRALAPLKDILSEHTSIHKTLSESDVRIYFRDCRDHVARLLEEIDTDRETARSLVDTCLSSMSNRMNEVMKVLTIISTIFIPLSFIAGLYGMNFDPDVSAYNMPELRWAFGYPAVLAVMALVGGGLLVYFMRKGWLK